MQQNPTTVSTRGRFSRRGMVISSGLVGLVVISTAVSVVWTADEKPAASPSLLKGILPDQVPVGLFEEDFEGLGKNWKDWSVEVASELAKFYEDDSLSTDEQRAILASLRRKLDVMETALADDAYQKIFDPLTALHARMACRVGVAEAALATLEQDHDAARKQQLDKKRGAVATALTSVVAYLNGLKNGEGWLPFIQADELAAAAKDAASAKAGLAVFKSARKRLDAGNKSLAKEQQDFLRDSEFDALRDALDSYLELAEKAATPVDQKKVRLLLADLVGGLESYESDARSESAAAVRKAFGELRDMLPDGAALIADALRSYYFNYNLRVTVSETLLQRLLTESHTEEGAVDDFILGAKVDGIQSTEAKGGVDVKPSQAGVRFDVTLEGTTTSNTAGVTDQATIYTYGYHRFWATKGVFFDGKKFNTEPADIAVDANNTTTGATTVMGNVPILSSFARSYAIRESQKKRPQSEAIARGRVASRVLPKFNDEVDKKFKEANADLDKRVNAPLKQLELFPDAMAFGSTEDSLLINTRLMASGELAGDTPQHPLKSDRGAVIRLHESLLNNSMDRLHIAGKTMTDQELLALFEKRFSILLGRPVKFGDKAKNANEETQVTTFVFDQGDPLRIQVDNGELTLTIRTGIKQEEGKEDIPTQVITIPISIKVENGNITLESGRVKVAPVVRPKLMAKQIARAGVVRKKVAAALPLRTYDATFTIERDADGPIDLSVTQIKAFGGWLSLVVE